MATTPPTAMRARTPPTPLHGPQYDSYEPYSPRRSKRRTAHNNPYSSFNGERSPKALFARNITPPATAKRTRFARAPPQLTSPPSSPVSPAVRHSLHKTPRKQNARRSANGALSDSDEPAPSLFPTNVDPTSMLPTPSKTPKKRPATAVTARILNFQPGSPSDVMPSPRKIQKHIGRHHAGAAGFELYESDVLTGRSHDIEIYTDPNARVPEMDESEDNPFVGAKHVDARPQRRRSRRSALEQEETQRMNDAVRRGEGVTYVFRGRTIFRKFESEDGAEDGSAGSNDLGNTREQQRLKHYAGASARRPLTRSAIKPRLLFPSEEEQAERERRALETDEEAVTDIEMSNAPSPVDAIVEGEEAASSPAQNGFNEVTPPATNGAKQGKKNKRGGEWSTTSPAGQDLNELAGADAVSSSSPTFAVGKKSKPRSPFESWARTKAGASKKRANEATEEGTGGGKRTRSSAADGSG